MGIIENTLRKTLRVGEEIDLVLIGGRELRGRLTAFAEDGILLEDGTASRPVAFAGIATCLPTCAQLDCRKDAPHSEPRASAPTPPVFAAPPQAQPAPVQQEERIFESTGRIERYDSTAGVGSIMGRAGRFLFKLDDVLDQQLADRLKEWSAVFGEHPPVAFQAHLLGTSRTATQVVLGAEEQPPAAPAEEPAQEEEPGERYGFGEILHFDKMNGYGKAREGDVKFLFKRDDIASQALWQEILRSQNTCGIKLAFTVTAEGKYTQLRELSALESPEGLTKPVFDELPPSAPQDQDENPYARVTFTDGTVMEDEVRVGSIMFYNPDKFFGRLQQEDGDRYYFRSNDVMQQSLLDFLNQRPALDIAETPVTFSVKTLPTGKYAAGRVCWNRPKGRPQAEAEAPAPKEPEPEGPASPAPRAEHVPVQLNRYLKNYLRAWGGEPSALLDHLLAQAEACRNPGVRADLMLERVALSDALREKRDDAMLRYLCAYTVDGRGDSLSSFLGEADYDGGVMFDALTRLFAVSEGAMGRLCGLIAGDSGLVTLRGEILARFGQVPESAAGLKACWRTTVDGLRQAQDYSALPPEESSLKCVDPEDEHPDWAQLLRALAAPDRDEAALRELLRSARENILCRPSRPAVEFMLPIVLDALESLPEPQEGGAAARARGLCAVEAEHARWSVLEVSGRGEGIRVRAAGCEAHIPALDGVLRLALPGGPDQAAVWINGRTGGVNWSRSEDVRFEARALPGAETQPDALAVLEREGVAVLLNGEDALEGIGRQAQEGWLTASLGSVQDAQTAARRMLDALKAALSERCGEDIAGLMAFPEEEPEGDAALAALRGVLHDFADLRLLHDKLKGLRVLCLVNARGGEQEMYRWAAELTGYGVHTALAAAERPAQAADSQVLNLGVSSLAAALDALGYPPAPLVTAQRMEPETEGEEK